MDTYLETKNLRILGGEFSNDLVHLLAWFGPWCVEVEQRDSVEILLHHLGEMFWRGHLDQVAGSGLGGHRCGVMRWLCSV